MRNIFIVLKHEFLTTIRKPLWVTTFLLPGMIILLNIGTQVVSQDAFSNEDQLIPAQT
ncbi:MAG: hypothetical protein R3E31_06995 [Chloroflexota bacterium]